MRKTTKRRDILKVAGFVALSIGILSASFYGVNRMALAGATNDVETLPPVTPVSAIYSDVHAEDAAFANLYIQSDVQTEDSSLAPSDAEEMQAEDVVYASQDFVPPTITVLESKWSLAVPEYALSMEDAAELGARYIWDVFGTCIDGMYLQMQFANHDSQSNTWWAGSVTAENPIVPDYVTYHPHMPYSFILDGLTGERIDIFYISEMPPESLDRNMDDILNARWAIVETGWFDMDMDEQIAFAGITSESLDFHSEIAMDFAVRHFVNSTVMNLELFTLNVNGLVASSDGYFVELAALEFSVTDNTGREALVRISTESALRSMVSVTTQHNDFIPGWSYAGAADGIG
jgi:hypothetical protein